MPQDRKAVPVYERGVQTDTRKGSVAGAAKHERTKTYAERMADEDAAKASKAKQKSMDDALLPSPQVKRALAAATGFPLHKR